MNSLSRILAVAATIAIFSASSVSAQTTGTTPTIKVITPGENQTIYGNKIPILFAVENLQLTDFQKTTAAAKGQGHIHVWLDESSPTKDSARKVIEDNTTYSDVPYGEHTLRAELVGNNHASLTPSVVVTIKFKSAPTASPSPAVTSGFDKNTALVILVVVALVIVAAWWYTKEEDEMPEASQKPKSVKKKTSRKKARK
ncbi:MAG: hypothetical protein Q8P25_00175 [Candidatus Curtissbacteria bacterium]|nr:hypothetical protein [Candidatus Curtissbacteria bacterium]